MSDIDWLAVEWVCSGVVLKLKPQEKRAVIRRLMPRMLENRESSFYTNKLSSTEVARRMVTTERSVERYKAELAGATETSCPHCRQRMWVIAGQIAPHPNVQLSEDCPMSGRETVRGLAATRPDLYRWLDEEVSA